MRTAVVGAGPVGLVCAHALAERGDEVLLVDPEVGPQPDGTWRRHGVMQFLHPHFFRFQVRAVLERVAPALWDAVVAAGAVVNPPPDGMPPDITSVACRRSTFEAALRGAVHPAVRFLPSYAEQVVVEQDWVTGLRVEGEVLPVDRVIAAHGRANRFADDLRPPGVGGGCGQSYVSRMYQALPGAEPLTSWVPLGAQYDGYLTIAFPQDAGTHSVLVVRASGDKALEALWHTEVFDRAAAAIPNLAPWTDAARFTPITDVMRGGTLTNTYRGQGTPPRGLFFVGDAVCTTNPSAGRGVTLGLRQAEALLATLTEHPDPRTASGVFDGWCQENIKPWYDDHVRDDAYLIARYAGQDVDVEAPLPSDLVASAIEDDPSLTSAVMPYLGMVALPSTLSAVQEQVRGMLRSGWRPRVAQGPTRDELVDLIRAVPA